MAAATRLSKHDVSVLGALFDPESSLSNDEPQHHPAVVYEVAETPNTVRFQKVERDILLTISTEDPNVEDVKSAIAKLDELISHEPTYASAYNNRAEARKLLCQIEKTEYNSRLLQLIFNDLTQAIKLATPISPLVLPSARQTNVLSSAYTHRAYLLYHGSRSEITRSRLEVALGVPNLSRESLEEMASKDFAMGGQYGNTIAKQLAVHTNPYAKLCGSIVKEAIKKEIEDYWASTPEATT